MKLYQFATVLLFVSLISIVSGRDEDSIKDPPKIDRVIPAQPTKDELLAFREKYEVICILRVVKQDGERFYEVDKVMRGEIAPTEFKRYVPTVDAEVEPGSTIIFCLGENERGKIANLSVIREDYVEKVGPSNCLFKGHTREEIIRILSSCESE